MQRSSPGSLRLKWKQQPTTLVLHRWGTVGANAQPAAPWAAHQVCGAPRPAGRMTSGGPYSLPLTERKEDGIQWEEEKLHTHNLGLKIQSWGCTCSVYRATVSRARATSVKMAASQTADVGAPSQHGSLGLQGPAQGVRWQRPSPNSEVWETEGSEVWSERSSSDRSFRAILEVITYSRILPHRFLSHLAFPQRSESWINLHLYTNPNFRQLLQVPLVILFTHTLSAGWENQVWKTFQCWSQEQNSVGKCSWLPFGFSAS